MIYFFNRLNYFFILILFSHILFGDSEKSSKEIQQDIDKRNFELNNLRKEIKEIEKRLINKNIEATQNAELLIDLTDKISLTEKLIKSLSKEEKNISNIIKNIDIELEDMEKSIFNLRQQLIKRLQYLYVYGRKSILETIFTSQNWNSTIYKIKYLEILSKYEKKIRNEMNQTINILELKK